MLQFKSLGKEVNLIKEYIEKSSVSFCDISLGTKYMWRDDYVCLYAIYDDTLILRESSNEDKDAFYFPMGKNVEGALEQIEKECQNKSITFCCVDNETSVRLSQKYTNVEVFSDRDWSDYIYNVEDFIYYKGKKYSGQRNHVNKFKKQNPDYVCKIIDKEDFEDIKTFLKEFERGEDYSMWTAREEQKKVFDLIENMDKINNFGACIKVKDKIVALSVGEIVQDTLIVHIEKGLKSYSGVYPLMAQEFAKTFYRQDVKYINREEDCGDMGLRISKLQYHPILIKDKNVVTIKTAFDAISSPVLIFGDRINVSEIFLEDKKEYFELCSNIQLNEFWGYDYREDLKDKPSLEYFIEFKDELIKNKEEHPLAIRIKGELIGEITLHNFDFYGGAEIGFRLLKEFQGKGYAQEATMLLEKYLFSLPQIKRLKCKCYKQNLSSKKLIEKLGFKMVKKDENMFYYCKEKPAW